MSANLPETWKVTQRTFIPCALSTTQRAASLDVNSSSTDMLLLADGTISQQKYPSFWPAASTSSSAHMASYPEGKFSTTTVKPSGGSGSSGHSTFSPSCTSAAASIASVGSACQPDAIQGLSSRSSPGVKALASVAVLAALVLSRSYSRGQCCVQTIKKRRAHTSSPSSPASACSCASVAGSMARAGRLSADVWMSILLFCMLYWR